MEDSKLAYDLKGMVGNPNSMFGTDLLGVRVKVVIKKLSGSKTKEYVKIPEYFYKIHELLTLTADIMFVSENMFMITPESKLKFMKVEYLPSQTAEQISKSSNKEIKLYGRGGFIIRVILMDMEF